MRLRRAGRPRAASLALVVGMSAALGASACGGAQKPAEPTPSSQTPSEAPAPPAPRRDLTPVSAPSGTFVWGRLHQPATLADSLLAATGLPLNWRQLLSSRFPELSSLAEANASLEVAVSVHPNPRRAPLAVVSLGVPSEQLVLDLLARENIAADEGAGGVHSFSAHGATCLVGPALGAAPARVVCGDEPDALDVLGPFALRGLPQQELSDAALHLEVAAGPLQAAYGQQVTSLKLLSSVLVRRLQIDSPRFDRAVADSVFGLVDEVIALSQDVERARVQLWDRGTEYELSISGRFQGATSWSLQTLHELVPQQQPPPGAFWALPAQSSAAYYVQMPKASRMRPVWDALRDALAGYLEHERDLGKATRQRIDRWLADAFTFEGPVVGATGPWVKGADEDALPQPAWQLFAFSGDAARFRKSLSELEAVLASPDLRKATGAQKSWLPELKQRGTLTGKAGSVVYEWKNGDLARALDLLRYGIDGASADTAELEASLKSLGSGFWALVPDGDHTWFVWAQERDRLAEPFTVMAKTDAPRARSLAGLAPLEARGALASGFYKLETLAASWGRKGSGAGKRPSWEQVSRSLPYRGEVPITFELRASEGEGTTLELVHHIPRKFLADLTAVLTQDL